MLCGVKMYNFILKLIHHKIIMNHVVFMSKLLSFLEENATKTLSKTVAANNTKHSKAPFFLQQSSSMQGVLYYRGGKKIFR